jgi:predicted component of type VI protein secretion system
MTNPHWAKISIVLLPRLDVSALRNLRRLLNCENLSLLDKAKPETRRDNEDSKFSSITDHLERYGIADINSEADSK